MVRVRELDKPFPYAPPRLIKARVAYLMAIRGLKLDGLHKLLEEDPSKSMVCYVCNGQKKSEPLEVRIATALGVTRLELFSKEPLKSSLWRAA